LPARSVAKRVSYPFVVGVAWLRGRLRRRRIIVYNLKPVFAPKCEALADLLRKRGFRAEIRSGLSFWTRALLKSSRDLWIGFWFGVPLDLLPKEYILWNPEPLDRPRERTGVDERWFEAIGRAREVWDYKRSNAEHLQALGVPFHVVPFGYVLHYELRFQKYVERQALRQDIDVLFVGTMCERRQRVLDDLERRGMNIHIVSGENRAYGAELDELLARSKIILGIHAFDEAVGQIVDYARVDYPISNGLFVLHERPSGAARDVAFEENVATCEYGEIGATCAKFLAAPEARLAKAAASREWFRTEFRLDDFVPYRSVEALLRQEKGK
jgi:hypothetical protein